MFTIYRPCVYLVSDRYQNLQYGTAIVWNPCVRLFRFLHLIHTCSSFPSQNGKIQINHRVKKSVKYELTWRNADMHLWI